MKNHDESLLLIARFRYAAVLHGEFTETGDYQKGNAQYKKLSNAFEKLSMLGSVAQTRFLDLLEDEVLSVRVWAAAYALQFAPDQAEATLSEIAQLVGHQATDARYTLIEWRAGRLKM